MLEWHPAPEGLGKPVAGPFRLSRQGTQRRREARAAGTAVALGLTCLLVVVGFQQAAWAGAVVAVLVAAGAGLGLRRVERSYFTRIVPAVEVHEHGVCFCDTGRGVHFEELTGLLVGSDSVFLAFKRGLDPSRDLSGKRVPLWERAVRRKAYWEVPLDGFAEGSAVVEAITAASGLPVQPVTDEVLAALQSRTAQGIARVPAPAVESRF